MKITKKIFSFFILSSALYVGILYARSCPPLCDNSIQVESIANKETTKNWSYYYEAKGYATNKNLAKTNSKLAISNMLWLAQQESEFKIKDASSLISYTPSNGKITAFTQPCPPFCLEYKITKSANEYIAKMSESSVEDNNSTYYIYSAQGIGQTQEAAIENAQKSLKALIKDANSKI